MKYVVSVRRDTPDGFDLEDALQAVGIITRQRSPRRVLIDVTPEKADELKSRFGQLIVEPEIMHGSSVE